MEVWVGTVIACMRKCLLQLKADIWRESSDWFKDKRKEVNCHDK